MRSDMPPGPGGSFPGWPEEDQVRAYLALHAIFFAGGKEVAPRWKLENLLQAVVAHGPWDTPPALLELGCGRGDILAFFGRRGYGITGLEKSREMLKIAQDYLRREQVEVRNRLVLLEADMTEFAAPAAFDVILATGFCHLLAEDARIKCIKKISTNLNDHGLCIFYNPYIIRAEVDRERAIVKRCPVTGHKMVLRNLSSVDFDKRIRYNYYIVETYRDGNLIRKDAFRYAFCFFEESEFSGFLRNHGFTTLEILTDNEINADMGKGLLLREMLFVTQKSGNDARN
jgi:SAM-dependent methyltransferase